MKHGTPGWIPSASLETIKARAELYGSVRAFFSARGVMEVETPILSAHATVDKFIESFATEGRWLQTSPEFAMKRLLAAGSGPVWQISRVFRREEAGRHHNPEFSMLEWYQPGFDHYQLMDEVAELFGALGIAMGGDGLSYRQAFVLHAGVDPFEDSVETLKQRFPMDAQDEDRDFWLDVLMSHVVGPQLGLDGPEFLYDFPPSQAALARVENGVAQRFELFWNGIELANGFHELTDGREQKQRFQADQKWRCEQQRVVPPYDKNLIAALDAGMPPCAGVALGLDRLLMLKLGLPDISSTLAFDSGRA